MPRVPCLTWEAHQFIEPKGIVGSVVSKAIEKGNQLKGEVRVHEVVYCKICQHYLCKTDKDLVL